MLVLIPGPADSLHIRLFSVGYIPLDSWWTHTDHIRSMWRLCRADNEGASLLYDSTEFQIPAGRFCLVPPGLNFETHLQQTVPLLFVHFEVVSWPITTVRDLVPEPIILAPDEFRDRLAVELGREIRACDHLGSALSCRVKSLVHLALATLEENLAGEKAPLMRHVVDGQLDFIEVLQFIDRHIDQPLDNKRLADIANSSESCFIRRFREVTGQTPARYVQDRRVARASELLVCTDYSIDDVAQRCGFANRFYFSRVFSERMGRPPARFRNERPIAKTVSRQQA